ncbi:SWIM zinc finger family protein [Thermus caldifontis]|uniref:SWIM zinc finger family protein n=1 Tax=Thermus caldifontis TaxID=1930763 RepID=UPI000DF1F0BA|nr:SWIM zinc finger family protein [Thermus caldifontis]
MKPFKERMIGFLNRLEKAKDLVERGKVYPVGGLPDVFVVESQEGGGFYLVDLGRETCTCPAWTNGKTRPCKHMVASALYAWALGAHPEEGERTYSVHAVA